GTASRTRTKRVRSLQSFEGQEPRQSGGSSISCFELLVEERGPDNGLSQIWLPFLDTYRTMCLAPQPEFRRLLEQARGSFDGYLSKPEICRPRHRADGKAAFLEQPAPYVSSM